MRGKPCPVGYNIFTLCEAGYFYGFLFNSPNTSFFDLPINSIEGVISRLHSPNMITTLIITELSKTSRAVLYLMLQLFQHLFFTLYCDNLFSNVNLFHILCHYDISACGTAQSTPKNWLKIFKDKINWKTTHLLFNFQTVEVVHDNVCAVIWQDKNLVQFITSYYNPRNMTLVDRKKLSTHNSSK